MFRYMFSSQADADFRVGIGPRAHLRALIASQVLLLSALAWPTIANDVDFEAEVLPILARRCALCHSEDRTEGDFSVATREALLKGGVSGPAAIERHAKESLLIELVEGADQERLMPAKGPRLTAKQVDTLRRWIDQGAP